MKAKFILFCLITLLAASCNPYKGFKGVSKKGMKTSTTPSQEIRNDYDKSSKRMKRSYKREMKRNRRKMGTKPTKEN